jgi:uncharacterized protein with von Willebrand factor type A (vWA) domain
MIKKIKEIIKAYILWCRYHINKSYRESRKEEAKRKTQICEDCKYFWKYSRNCMLCGCFIDVKVLYPYEIDEKGISINGCPEKKW